MEGFTHKAKFEGIPCYYNIDTQEVKGTNWFYDFIIDHLIDLDQVFEWNNKDGWKIEIIEEI